MAIKDKIRLKVMELAKEATEVAGVELFDVELSGQVGNLTVRVTIDSEHGIGINDCERVSRQLEALLDIEDPVPGSYTLEVTSPGLDRPLRNIQDFRRFQGKLVRIVTNEKIDNQTFFIGRIAKVTNNTVIITIGKKELGIPYEIINRANLEIEL
ncbi:MAG: ribosome maturation factor RimP [Nitrospirae bacterium]|nr:ribosome maturation factor RimP [Nitrospirota bacterium]